MVMGYELVPDNALFADAQDSGLAPVDLEYSKPEAADFDIGGENDLTDLSATDFDLGPEELGDFDETIDDLSAGLNTEEVPDTVAMESVTSDNLKDDDETNIRAELEEAVEELPDEIGEIDLDDALEDAEESVEEVVEDELNFELPDDLDLSSDAEKEPLVDTSSDTAELPGVEDIELDMDDEVPGTMVMDSAPDTSELEADVDLDISEIEPDQLQTGNFTPVRTG